MSSLLVRGGRIVYPWGLVEADVLVVNGVVRGVGRGLREEGAEVLDASGKLVLPGVVDVHVHMREPGLEYKDNFENGTRDAIQGGVTTVLEMPNTLPPVDRPERLREKRELLSRKAYCDFGLYGVIHDKNVDQVEKLIEEGVVGFKVFLGPTTGNILPPSQPAIYEAMSVAAKRGVTIAFHAEEWDLVEYFTSRARGGGRSDPLAHLDSRPPVCEEISIYRVGAMARATGARVHIVHISSCSGLSALEHLKGTGADITGETNPHYLLLDVSDYERLGPTVKVNPPIRGGAHRECLWRGVRSGSIDIVASDHAPHSVEEKSGDVWSASSGFPGVHTLLPLMIDSALSGRLELTKIPKLLSENPAKRFGLYPRKGCLHPGCDGDLVVVDPEREWTIDRDKMYCKNKVTPFHGWRVRGYVEYTVLRGSVVYDRGEIAKPVGEFLKPL